VYVFRVSATPSTTSASTAPLGDVIKGTWLGSAAAVAVCASTFSIAYPPYAAIVATAGVLIAVVLVVARTASRSEGARGAVLAAAGGAGALPALVVVSLYAATRPLMRYVCTDRGCYPKLDTILFVGAGVTLVPLVMSTVAVIAIANRRREPLGGFAPAVGAVAMILATLVAGAGVARGLVYPTTDHYLENVPEVGRVGGASFPAPVRDVAGPVIPSSTPELVPLLDAKWTAEPDRGRPCRLSIAGGSYDIPAVETTSPDVICPAVRVRHDASRGIVVIDAKTASGELVPAFSVDTKNGGVSGPTYADGHELPRIAPSRVWIIAGAAGVLAAIALVLARLRAERNLLAQWRAAAVGRHRGDGWVAFDDDASPPLHIASAADLPAGEVRVTGLARSAGGGYRSTGAGSSSGAVAADLATIERTSRERIAGTIAVYGLVAFIAATPVGAGLFVLMHG
jgi:hypothetical protein